MVSFEAVFLLELDFVLNLEFDRQEDRREEHFHLIVPERALLVQDHQRFVENSLGQVDGNQLLQLHQLNEIGDHLDPCLLVVLLLGQASFLDFVVLEFLHLESVLGVLAFHVVAEDLLVLLVAEFGDVELRDGAPVELSEV